jgi:tetratricopeptide (TPR) repeat protein
MNRISKLIIGIAFGLLFAGTVSGQKAERDRIREGNKLYNKEQFTEAEIAYRKSLEVNSRSFDGIYDLGNALYQQQKFPEAAEQYQLVAAQSERFLSENPANVKRLAQVFHNMGNIGMQYKDYANSIEAYKQSLRLNPMDDETRYNLALAQKLLENQEQEEDEEQQQGEDQQDEQQDQQEDDQNQNQQPRENEQDHKTQEEQQPDERMSRDNAQQILDAFLEDEKDVQDKVRQIQEQQRERRRTDRQW